MTAYTNKTFVPILPRFTTITYSKLVIFQTLRVLSDDPVYILSFTTARHWMPVW